MLQTVRIWDLPTRVFHWALVPIFAALIVTGELGDDWMSWHSRLGYLALALLLFRCVWGFVGGYWSRFAHFVVNPAQTWRYLHQTPSSASAGHNPLGAWSVLSLLFLLLLQIFSGLALDDENDFVGPLSAYISEDVADWLFNYHLHIGKKLLILLVSLHVAAIAFYRLRRGIDLVRPMLFGDKSLQAPVPSSRDDRRSRTWAVLIFTAALALVFWLSRF
jgi:cytochrome b